MCTGKVQSLIVLLLKHTCTNIQTCSPSLQPWEWRMLRFKVISSIQQPGALHCRCTTSSLLTHALKHTHKHMRAQHIGGRRKIYTPHITNAHPRQQSVCQVRTRHFVGPLTYTNSRRCESSMGAQLSIFVPVP